MAEECKRRSIYGNVEKTGEKSERRRSFFERPDLNTQERNAADAVLKEWNRRWGKYDLDYVNVVKYPKEYVQKIKEQKEMWLDGIDRIYTRGDMIEEEEETGLIITKDVLTAEQKESIGIIDSKINEYIDKSTSILREFQVNKRMLEIKLEKNERETKMIEKMTISHLF